MSISHHVESVCLWEEVFQKKDKDDLWIRTQWTFPAARVSHKAVQMPSPPWWLCPAVSQYVAIIGIHQKNIFSGKIENFYKNKQIQIFKFSWLELKCSSFYPYFEPPVPWNTVTSNEKTRWKQGVELWSVSWKLRIYIAKQTCLLIWNQSWLKLPQM